MSIFGVVLITYIFFSWHDPGRKYSHFIEAKCWLSSVYSYIWALSQRKFFHRRHSLILFWYVGLWRQLFVWGSQTLVLITNREPSGKLRNIWKLTANTSKMFIVFIITQRYLLNVFWLYLNSNWSLFMSQIFSPNRNKCLIVNYVISFVNSDKLFIDWRFISTLATIFQFKSRSIALEVSKMR